MNPIAAIQLYSQERVFAERHYRYLYETLMSTIPSSVLLIDQNLRVIAANQNFLNKARRSESNTIGHHLDEVFPAVILAGIALGRRIRQVLETGEPVQGERLTYRAPGVAQRIYYYTIIPTIRSGNAQNVMLLMEDITELIRLNEEARQAERHLASVVQSASDIVVSTNPKGRIITWNRAAENVAGYSLEEVKNHFFHEFFTPVHRGSVEAAFQRFDSVNPWLQAEWTLTTKDQRNVPVSWVCSPMKDERGSVEGVVAVGRDLTEQRKLEAQILQSQKLAALGVMAGGIAHEIRNPLAIASSAAQFLFQCDVTPEFLKDCADKIHRGIQRASDIIENLLRFARPSIPQNAEPVDLTQVIEDTLGFIENETNLRNIQLVVQVGADPVIIIGHACLLQQLLVNLILNACKAMPKGGMLGITLERDGDQALLRICDTGCGIPKKDVDRVFEPFYTTNRVGDGVGLGLSLCYSIVKQHFGAIEVESAEGSGATFTVRLPAS